MKIYPGISQNRVLFGVVGVLGLVIIITATGGGLFKADQSWITDWQHRAFSTLCHQDPARSFWIGSQPMAVCSRCYGIYLAFGFSWFLIPLAQFIPQKIHATAGRLLVLVIVLNVVDVVGNLVGFWQNTLAIRFFMGSGIGLAAVLLLADNFLHKRSKIERDAYGLNRTI